MAKSRWLIVGLVTTVGVGALLGSATPGVLRDDRVYRVAAPGLLVADVDQAELEALAEEVDLRKGSGPKPEARVDEYGRPIAFGPPRVVRVGESVLEDVSFQRKRVTFDHYGDQAEIVVIVTTHEGKTVVVPDTASVSDYVLHGSRDGMRYVFRGPVPFPDGAYLLEVDRDLNLMVSQLTPPRIGPYDMEALVDRLRRVLAAGSEDSSARNIRLIWAESPTINPSGDRVAYVSNRRQIAEAQDAGDLQGEGTSDIWVVDLTTGEHRSITRWEGFAGLWGWLDDRLLVGHHLTNYSVQVIDTSTGEVHEWAKGEVLGPLDVVGDTMTFQPEPGRRRFGVLNLVTGEVRYHEFSGGRSFMGQGAISPEADRVVHILAAGSETNREEIVVMNLVSGEVVYKYRVDSPWGVAGQPQWVDDRRILVTVRDIDRWDDETLILTVK